MTTKPTSRRTPSADRDAIEIRKLTKSFGSVLALDGLDMTVRRR